MTSDLAEYEHSGTAPPAPPAPPGSERPKPRRPRYIRLFGLAALVVFLVAAAGMSYQGKLSGVQKNDNASYLPGSAESTKVQNEAEKFQTIQTIPGFVVYQRAGRLTDADNAKIAADLAAFAKIPGVAADQLGKAQPNKDDSVVSVAVPLVAKRGTTPVNGQDLSNAEKKVVDVAKANAPPGLAVHSAGAGGLLVAFIDAFSGIDGTLLLAAGLVVVVILLVVYRSPVLWFYPLFSSVLALGTASLVIYPLAKHGALTLTGQSQGILSVVVIGAGTDYALLLVSRYREELHNHVRPLDAMITAWKGVAAAIAASGLTVVIGLLCLMLGELNSNKSLGPVCAIGVACTVVVMLVFLPAFLLSAFLPAWVLSKVLALFRLSRLAASVRSVGGRWLFWPRIPRFDHRADIATHGGWSRFADGVGRRRRLGWVATTVFLLICIAFLPTLKDGGLSTMDSFTSTPDAIVGQKIYDANFDAGAGTPVVIAASAAKSADVISAVSQVPGVDIRPGSVCVETDYGKITSLLAIGEIKPSDLSNRTACPPASLQVQPVGGRILIDAQLVDAYDSKAAETTVLKIRDTVRAIPGADARVGGSTAINHDVEAASRHDRNVVIPIVLLVILVVLGLLLRAVLAPVLLIVTVVLSFAASLGVAAVAFNHVFHFANADPGYPLFAFVFLVALGIDYNIFLMTRVREETLTHGTRRGIVRGLSVTGGVITSAGVVLASTFAVLGVLPLVGLAEIGFTVAFGVLLDTIIVRSILVPALSHDIGKSIWWPSKLARAAD
jgi:RND superfamily putative drug exporter